MATIILFTAFIRIGVFRRGFFNNNFLSHDNFFRTFLIASFVKLGYFLDLYFVFRGFLIWSWFRITTFERLFGTGDIFVVIEIRLSTGFLLALFRGGFNSHYDGRHEGNVFDECRGFVDIGFLKCSVISSANKDFVLVKILYLKFGDIILLLQFLVFELYLIIELLRIQDTADFLIHVEPLKFNRLLISRNNLHKLCEWNDSKISLIKQRTLENWNGL